MSNVLKIFVVLNFVLAVVFVATAATLLGKADNWKKEHDTVKEKAAADLKDRDGQISTLTGENKSFKDSNQQLTNRRDELKSELQSSEDRREEKNRENADLRGSLKKSQDNLATLGQNLSAAQTDRETYEKRMTAAEKAAREAVAAKEAAEDEARRLTAALETANEMTGQLETDLATVRADLEKQKNLVKLAMASGWNPGNVINAPPIDAVVQRVNPELKFVMLSVGGQDKVTKGMRFTISRGGNYIGDVLVDAVYPTVSAAQIVMTNPGATFKAGDTATTRVN